MIVSMDPLAFLYILKKGQRQNCSFLLLLFLFVPNTSGNGLDLQVTNEILQTINKCCSETEGLVRYMYGGEGNSFFECSELFFENITEGDNAPSDLPLAPLEISQENFQFSYGFPEGCEYHDLKQRLLSSVKRMPKIYCVDKFIAERNDNSSIILGDGSIIILTCDTNPTPDDSFERLNVTKVNKCCPEHMAYDTDDHRCVSKSMLDPNYDYFGTDVFGQFRSFIRGDTVLLDIKYGLEKCQHPKIANEYHISDYDFSLKDDVLTLTGADTEIVLNSESFCIDESVAGPLIARGCKLGCDGICITKCCPEGHVYVLRNGTCGMRGVCLPSQEWGISPQYYNISGRSPIQTKPAGMVGVKYKMSCTNGQFLLNNNEPADEFFLDAATGYLYVPGQPTSMNGLHNYCVEVIESSCPGKQTGIYGLLCFPEDLNTAKLNNKLQLFSVALLISSIFLAATLLVYIMLPALRNLHGQTLMCHVGTMLVAYSCLTRIQWSKQQPSYCKEIGYAIYFSFLAAFSWLNIMCFDIWWTFGNVRSVQGMRRNKDRKKFALFSLYAWGLPLVLTIITYLLDEYGVAPGWLDPNVGQSQCWISTSVFKAPVLILFIMPAGIQIGINIVLFILTTIHCNKVKNEIHRMQAGSTGERYKRRFMADKAKYTMNLKLFLVMGVSWVMEIVSSLYNEPHQLWYVADFFNTLQGIPLFCILVLKRKVYRLMKKRLGLENRGPLRSQGTGGATTTTGISSYSEKSGKKNIINNISPTLLSVPQIKKRKSSS